MFIRKIIDTNKIVNPMNLETRKIGLIERLLNTTDEKILKRVEKFFNKVEHSKGKSTFRSQLSPSTNYRKRRPAERIVYIDDLL